MNATANSFQVGNDGAVFAGSEGSGIVGRANIIINSDGFFRQRLKTTGWVPNPDWRPGVEGVERGRLAESWIEVEMVRYHTFEHGKYHDITVPLSEVLNVEPIEHIDQHDRVFKHRRKAAIEPLAIAWRGGTAAPSVGTPIEEWVGGPDGMPASFIPALRARGFVTIDNIATASDAALTQMAGVVPDPISARTAAQRWLQAKFMTAMNQPRAASGKEAELERIIDEQRSQIAEMMSAINRLLPKGDEEDAPRRRGRSPRAVADHVVDETEAA